MKYSTLLVIFQLSILTIFLFFSESIDEYWKHLNIFFKTITNSGLVVSSSKISLFQSKVRFLGHNIHYGKITPIDRAIQFADKFPDEILDKTQFKDF